MYILWNKIEDMVSLVARSQQHAAASEHTGLSRNTPTPSGVQIILYLKVNQSIPGEHIFLNSTIEDVVFSIFCFNVGWLGCFGFNA